MFTYVNQKTGASFRSECECAGGDWVRAEAKTPKAAKAPKTPKAAEESKAPEAEGAE